MLKTNATATEELINLPVVYLVVYRNVTGHRIQSIEEAKKPLHWFNLDCDNQTKQFLAAAAATAAAAAAVVVN